MEMEMENNQFCYVQVLGNDHVDVANTAHYTLHPTHCTLHPTHYTLHPTSYTRHLTPCTQHTGHYTLHAIPTHCTLHTTHYTLTHARVQVLGNDHVDVANTVENIGVIYAQQGNHQVKGYLAHKKSPSP